MYSSCGGNNEYLPSFESSGNAIAGSRAGAQHVWPVLPMEKGACAIIPADTANLPGALLLHRIAGDDGGRVLLVLHRCITWIGRLEPRAVDRFRNFLVIPLGISVLRL